MADSGILADLGGGAPTPDRDRVAALHAALTGDPGTCAAYAEPARAALAALNDRTLAETRTSDLGECAILLGHVRDRVAALDPARLQPRRGLAGLFDSRGARLKAFRQAYSAAGSALGDAAGDIADRGAAIARKGIALETLWAETRDAIAELDAHIAAARAWLDERVTVEDAAADASADEDPGSDRIEAQADAEADQARARQADAGALAVDGAPEGATVTTLPHPLAVRLSTLAAVRAVAIGRLPLLRAAQNADCRAPAALKEVCDTVIAWRAEWKDALGLSGKKPRKIRPDPVRLSLASEDLERRVAVAERAVQAAQARRAELDHRTAPAEPARIAA